MVPWRFFDYITEEGENLMAIWYAAQEPAVRARFDATLLILRATDDWTRKQPRVEEFKALMEQHAGLGEVRFHILATAPGAPRPHRRRFRPVGIWPTAFEREFVFLMGCEKIGRAYMPHAAFDTALKHKALLESGKGSIRERI